MTPEQLKASILQMAIQGKLVEQRPEEGTAEELYQKIQEEKQKLIKEGKIKKEKPLAEIAEDEIPFEIPESWKWARWGNLSQNIQYGYNASAQQKGRIKMVRISDIQDEKVVWDTVPYCDISEEEIGTYLLKENDILFARTGGTVGKSFLVDTVPEDAIYAGYLIRSSYSEKICPKYIKCFMGTKLYWDQLRNGTIATAQPNCNGQTLSKMMVPLPPFKEQHRIVSKIEELLPYVDRYAEAYEKLEQFNAKFPEDMKKSILQYAIQGKLVEQRPKEGTAEELYQKIQEEKQRLIKEGKIKKEKPLPEIDADEIPFDIPESWKWVHLNNIATSSLGKTLNKSTDMGDEVSYLCSINVYWEGINLDKIKTAKFDSQAKEKYRLQKGDLLICEGGEAGRSAIWDLDEEMYYQNALHRVRFYGNVNARYMCYVLEYYKKNGTIANYTKGIGIQHLVQASLNSIWLPLPPLAEQQRIVAKIEELLPYCERLMK